MTTIGRQHQVIFFPTLGRLNDDESAWLIDVRGAVVDPEKISLQKKLLLRILRRVMNAPPEALQTEIFRERIATFAAAGQRGKRVQIQIGDIVRDLSGATKGSGLFSGTVEIGLPELAVLRDSGDLVQDWLKFSLCSSDHDVRPAVGCAQLLPSEGVSIISDIDDTIKHSDVNNSRELLNNTFLREFEWVEGMSPVYRDWAKQGAAIHYVSSSPWQLYEPLSGLCDDERFPIGTFHLRYFRLRDHMIKRMLFIRRRGKENVIYEMVRDFPRRRFILIGDSGERDPEIYGSIARCFPQRVTGIFIRELPGRKMNDKRWRRAFGHLPENLCHSFTNANELPKQLPKERFTPELV